MKSTAPTSIASPTTTRTVSTGSSAFTNFKNQLETMRTNLKRSLARLSKTARDNIVNNEISMVETRLGNDKTKKSLTTSEIEELRALLRTIKDDLLSMKGGRRYTRKSRRSSRRKGTRKN